MKKLFFLLFTVISTVGILCSLLFGKILYERGYTECTHKEFHKTVVPPSCTAEGKTVNVCKNCSYEYISDVVRPNGHSLSETVSPPSCTDEGFTLYYCACGYSFTSDITPPTLHNLECSITSPTCTEQGYMEYHCTACDYSFKSDFCKPLGHSFEKKHILPTATQAGYTEYTCECSYSYIGDRVYYSDILENAYTDNTAVIARGIDVSRWNHQIDTASGEYLPLDWELIKSSGYSFVILKAGSTRSGIEPTFEEDYRSAKAAGLMVGAYFYTYSSTQDGIQKDAELLLNIIKGKKFEYPIYLDLEDPSLSSLGKNHLSGLCVTFLEILQANGYYSGLYTNHTWLTTILDTPKIVSLFDLWYARYPLTDVPVWNSDKYGRQLGMWQYTQSGSIEGIEGSFDLNYTYKDYPAIMQKWGLNGF